MQTIASLSSRIRRRGEKPIGGLLRRKSPDSDEGDRTEQRDAGPIELHERKCPKTIPKYTGAQIAMTDTVYSSSASVTSLKHSRELNVISM